MKKNYSKMPNGYLETIEKGIDGVRHFQNGISRGNGTRKDNIQRLKKEIEEADAVIIGAGAGVSTSAGFVYNGERFERYFFDFAKEYGIQDMYTGGFYPFPDEETQWAWWSRHIYYNRYVQAPKPVYRDLLKLMEEKDYFVITTNVDHQFQKAGFAKERLFYTQGDYGLFQSVDPANQNTYDNEEWVMKAMESQGFTKDEQGIYQVPRDKKLSMRLPSSLVPKCPDDGTDVRMNLRADDAFVQDEGWHKASAAYAGYLKAHQGKHILFMEIGVGANTPVIIKYPFWQMTNDNPNAVYACLNYNEAYCPRQIEKQSIVLDGDTGEILSQMLRV